MALNGFQVLDRALNWHGWKDGSDEYWIGGRREVGRLLLCRDMQPQMRQSPLKCVRRVQDLVSYMTLTF